MSRLTHEGTRCPAGAMPPRPVDARAWFGRLSIALLCLSFSLSTAAAQTSAPAERWVGAWASSQQVPEPNNALPAGALDDATLRQIVRLTLGGSQVRVRVSNVFGVTPLVITAARIARPVVVDGPAIDPATDRALTFAGRPGVTIPAGAEVTSDPLALETSALDSLAVSLHFASMPSVQTSHPGSRATSYVAKGDRTGAADLPDALRVDHWYSLAGVDVLGGGDRVAIAVIGDSITDGYGVVANSNTRWTDGFAERLQASIGTARFSVLNHGLGGNRVLLDGLGPNALARFERDVLGQTGVGYFIIMEGVNDLGSLTRERPASPQQHADLVHFVTAAYGQMVERARARGIVAIGATITPFSGSDYYRPPAETEASRNAINAWIRTPGNFDAVIDFDAVMRDPGDPTRLRPEVDNDGLHPSMAGYRVMADAAAEVISRIQQP